MADISMPDARPADAAQLANGVRAAAASTRFTPTRPDDAAPSPTKAGVRSASKSATDGAAAGTKLRIDASDLTSSYCNVCNASSTREEVVLNFGVNHDWDRGAAGADVKMLHRIILSPFAAKRVSQLLGSLLKEYEARHGELK